MGRGTIESIAARFGAIEFEISDEEHLAVVERIRQSSSDVYEKAYSDALGLIGHLAETRTIGMGAQVDWPYDYRADQRS